MALLLLSGGPAASQTPSTFEVASIRPNTSGDGSMIFQILPGGRFRAINATLRELVRAAYQFQFQSFQLDGGDRWTTEARFDVEAKAEGEPTPEQVSAMVRALLADRFKLVTRVETLVTREARARRADLRFSVPPC